MERHAENDSGQAAIALVAVVSVIFIATVAALVSFGASVLDRTRAQTAADAAALASVTRGRAAANAAAARLGGVVVSWQRDGDDITVVVHLGDAAAIARATDVP